MAICYLLTNTVNGKQYVGFTTQPLADRWRQHRSDARTRPRRRVISQALCKYGHEAFTCRILGRGSRDEMLSLERAKIIELITLSPNGYNRTEGGEYWEFTEAARDKLRGRKCPWVTAAMNQRWADPDNRKRYGLAIKAVWENQDHRDRLTASRARGSCNGKSRMTEDIVREIRRLHTDGGTFAEIARQFGIHKSTARKAILGISWAHVE